MFSGARLYDAPVTPAGMVAKLSDRSAINILDVGGNQTGSVQIGQFSEFVNGEDAIVFYIVNPYRLLSRSTTHIRDMMEAVTSAARIRQVHLISNPNAGGQTTRALVVEGHRFLERLLIPLATKPRALVVPDFIDSEGLSQLSGLPVFRIRPYIQYP